MLENSLLTKAFGLFPKLRIVSNSTIAGGAQTERKEVWVRGQESAKHNDL